MIAQEGSKRPVGGARLGLMDDSARVVAEGVSDSTSAIFYLLAPARGHYRIRIMVGRGGLFLTPAFDLDTTQVLERMFLVPEVTPALRDAYLPTDVTTRAALQPNQKGPRYPDIPRKNGIRAVIKVLFVVDAKGRPDMKTFRVIDETAPGFVSAIKNAVSDWHYYPAKLEGKEVPQVVDQFFDFGFGMEPSAVREANLMVIRTMGVMRRVPM